LAVANSSTRTRRSLVSRERRMDSLCSLEMESRTGLWC
jgi:hypothetical protein